MTRESYLETLKKKLPDERREALMPRRIEKCEKPLLNKEKDKETWTDISSDELLTDSKPILLWGQSGNGKTTWLRTWAIELLSEQSNNWFPIFRHCNQIPDNVRETPEQWLKQLLKESYPEETNPTSLNVLLLLDGLDQSTKIEHVAALINYGNRWHFSGKVIIAVASRDNSLGNDIQILRFTRPNNSEIRNFLDSDYSKIEPILNLHPFLAEEPMLLEMLKELVTNTDTNFLKELSGRAELYAHFMLRIQEKELNRIPELIENKRPIARTFLKNDFEDILAEVALRALLKGHIQIFPKKLLDTFISQSDQEELWRCSNQLLEKSIEIASFRHQSFQAYYAAKHLHREDFRSNNPLFLWQIAKDRRFLINPAWREVIQFYLCMDDVGHFNQPGKKNPSYQIARLYIEIALENSDKILFNFLEDIACEMKNNPNWFKATFPKFESQIPVWFNQLDTYEFAIQLLVLTNCSSLFIALLKGENNKVRLNNVIEVIAQLGNESHIPLLLKLLINETSEIRQTIVNVIGMLGNGSHIPLLLPLLSHEYSEVRQAIVNVIGRLGNEGHIPLLLPLLSDEDNLVRCSAVLTIQDLGHEGHIPYLLPLLMDQDIHVRTKVIESIGKLGNETHIALLIPLLNDDNIQIRSRAVLAIGDLGNDGHITYFLPLLTDQHTQVRSDVVESIGKLGSETHIALLIPLLNDREDWVRSKAIESIGKLGNEIHTPLLIPFLNDEEDWLRSTVIYAIGRLGMRNDRHINVFLSLLNDEDNWVRHTVMEIIEFSVNETHIPLLIQFLNSEDYEIRGNILKLIGKLGNNSHIPHILPLLTDQNALIRSKAVESMEELGNETHIPYLLPLLMDQDSLVRRTTVESIGELGNETHIPYLLPLLTGEDDKIRYTVLEAIGKLGNASHIPYLLPLLTDQDTQVRSKAVESIGEIGNESHISLLIPLLNNKNNWFYINVVEAIGKLGNASHIPYLLPLLEDKSEWIRENVAEAIRKQGDETHIPACLSWIKKHPLDSKIIRIFWSYFAQIKHIKILNLSAIGSSSSAPLILDVLFIGHDTRTLRSQFKYTLSQPLCWLFSISFLILGIMKLYWQNGVHFPIQQTLLNGLFVGTVLFGILTLLLFIPTKVQILFQLAGQISSNIPFAKPILEGCGKLGIRFYTVPKYWYFQYPRRFISAAIFLWLSLGILTLSYEPQSLPEGTKRPALEQSEWGFPKSKIKAAENDEQYWRWQNPVDKLIELIHQVQPPYPHTQRK